MGENIHEFMKRQKATKENEDFLEFLVRKGMEKEKRPDMLEKPLPIYEHEDSRIPDGIRVSFEDGTTAVYYLHMEQPAPLIFENIRIIRRMKQGYVNQPMRRRNRK